MNQPKKKIEQQFIIPSEFATLRLDQALAKLLTDYSRVQIKTWIDAGNILLNNQLAKAKTKLRGGEAVSLKAEFEAQADWEAEAIPLPILYEDEAIIIIDKPAGMVVHPGTGNQSHTMLNALLHHAPQLALLPRVGILHRLDKNTSGLLLVAKNHASHKFLSGQLKKRLIGREYQTIVNGLFISGGTVSAPIGRHPTKRQQMAVVPLSLGKEAITHYRVMEKYRSHTRLKITLETGRTHQIRVHMHHLRHSVVGDPTYAGRLQFAKGLTEELKNEIKLFKRQALHAYRLTFIHPDTELEVSFESKIPSDFQQLITALKKDNQQKTSRH
ncbi:MAG: 23S rRNA pseudouridine(1911/1915/1917) synthase RluD [Gammaproteobacteria bacterium]|nr:23S rRNA pseudouridine(1911/1915/1917) synthase RluD [Gammaproteobacteria bacterium]